MMKDTIVEEVRALRAEMLKQAGGTLDGLAAMLRRKRELRQAINTHDVHRRQLRKP